MLCVLLCMKCSVWINLKLQQPLSVDQLLSVWLNNITHDEQMTVTDSRAAQIAVWWWWSVSLMVCYSCVCDFRGWRSWRKKTLCWRVKRRRWTKGFFSTQRSLKVRPEHVQVIHENKHCLALVPHVSEWFIYHLILHLSKTNTNVHTVIKKGY